MTSVAAPEGRGFAVTGQSWSLEKTQLVSTMVPRGSCGICPRFGRLTLETTVPKPISAREGETALCHSDGFGDPFGLLPFPEIHRGQPELPVLHGLGIFQIPTDGDEFCQMPVADLLALVLEVASGKKTRTEEKGFREISIFKDGVVL